MRVSLILSSITIDKLPCPRDTARLNLLSYITHSQYHTLVARNHQVIKPPFACLQGKMLTLLLLTIVTSDRVFY